MAVTSADTEQAPGRLVHRHALSTRLWHWLCAAMMIVLLMSGLMIFNAHPRLYWGEYGANPDPAWLEIRAEDQTGYVRIGDWRVTTTGVLGYSASGWGMDMPRAFPTWATIPAVYDLVEARRWHLTLAWPFTFGTLFFGIWSFLNGHVRRDLLPRRDELRPGHLWRECCDHVRISRLRGALAQRYNVLQKLVYLTVIAIVVPGLILTGLSMSPRVNSVLPWLTDIFGGRQSARSIHFIAAFTMVLFVVVHIVMVILAGPFNAMRSMITGWCRLPRDARTDEERPS